MWNNFKMWRDLLSGNYESYALLKEDDPYQECYEWFWSSINMDECLDRDFLDYLQQIVEDVETGKEKLIPMTLEELDDISHLLNREEEEEEWE